MNLSVKTLQVRAGREEEWRRNMNLLVINNVLLDPPTEERPHQLAKHAEQPGGGGGGEACLMRWIYIHRVVDYVDLAEPEREGTTEEMVDAHDHAHVEVPEDNDANFIKVQKPT